MPFPIDLTRCLAFAPTNTPLEVCSIPSDDLRARLALDALFEGDEIIREPDASGRVITRLANDHRVAIERPCAIRIEVAPSRAAVSVAFDRRGDRAGYSLPVP